MLQAVGQAKAEQSTETAWGEPWVRVCVCGGGECSSTHDPRTREWRDLRGGAPLGHLAGASLAPEKG